MEGRYLDGCHQEFASYAHGTKGSAVISTSSHFPARSRIYKSQKFVKEDLAWQFGPKEQDPYQLEWDNLMEAIRKDKPFNEARRGAEASLVTAMGRMAAHTGRVVTRDEMLNHDHEMAPTVDKLTMAAPAPLQLGKDGKYAVPQPGITVKREY